MIPKHKHHLLRGIFFIAILATLAILALRLVGALQRLEWLALDTFVQLRPEEALVQRVALVVISEADIQKLNQWPLSDDLLAQLLQKVNTYHPRAIGLDLYRDLPISPGTEKLNETFTKIPHLIGIEKVASVAVPPPPLLKIQGQTGASDVVIDKDGKVRRFLLSLVNYSDETVLSLPLHLALIYLKKEGITPSRQGETIHLGKAIISPLKPNSGSYINADVGGFQVLANYARLSGDYIQVSFTSLMAGKVPEYVLYDRIVLIGTTAASLGDRFQTPLPSNRDNLPGTPGVELHAEITSQLLSAALENRPLLKSWQDIYEWLWVLVWAAIGAYSVWIHRVPLATGISIFSLMVGLVSITFILFIQGWWIPVIPPLFSLTSSAVFGMTYVLWRNLLLSQQKLAEYASSLEEKVKERTRELREKNLELEKAKKAAEAASEAKGRFLATMSHELRTPLTAIIGYTELLQQEIDPESPGYSSTEVILRSGLHLLRLINDVLAVSKIEAGQVTLELQTFDLFIFLDSVIEVFVIQAKEKGIALHYELSPEVPKQIITDERKLRQILLNLLSNAVKFTDRGGVTLRVSYEQRLFFSVEDTGFGISPEEMANLFQPFVQTESGKSSVEGTGLGLTITKQFVELMGGEITVSSTLGVGTCFQFSIEILLPETIEIEPVPDLLPPQEVHNSPTSRILIAEDNLLNRRLLFHILQSGGYAVEVAENGEQAVEIWESWHPHLIFMDVSMPVMNGYEATKAIRIREQKLGATHTNIVAITAHAFAEEYANAMAAGCDGFLHKPYKRIEILETINQYNNNNRLN